MVFAESPRRVNYQAARLISRAVKNEFPGTAIVGVFVNSPFNEVNKTAEKCRLDFIQLSGDETAEYCLHIERPVIKAIRIPAEGGYESLETYDALANLFHRRGCILLMDTFHQDKRGGTGKIFDWELARPFCGRFRTVIAGGLNPENVSELINSINPWGVDVSSGVEVEGKKDALKIRSFINAVRRTDEINCQEIS
jgi:phosphoribosylanthranilate isomerase